MDPAPQTIIGKISAAPPGADGIYEPKHIPALDGVRGIAIGLVMLTHLGAIVRTIGIGPYLEFGWMGVDLFFVLSGFLITRILLDTRTDERYYRRFYIRRGLRIWPLYYLYIPLTILLVHVLGRMFARGALPGGEHLSWNIVSPIWIYFFFLQNLNPASLFSFDDAMLGLTWSLCIEEHFYLAWPVCVRNLPQRALNWTLIAILAISPILRLLMLFLDRDKPLTVWYQTIIRFTPMHLDAIAAGCLLSLAWARIRHHKNIGRWFAVLFAAGLSVTVLCFALQANRILFAFCYSAVAVMFAGLTGMVLRGWCNAFFTKPFLRYTGKISYGLYLIHPTVFVLLQSHHLYSRFGMGNHVKIAECISAAMAVALSVLIASLSWKFYESKMLSLKAVLAP